MITITDTNKHVLTLDDAELTAAEIRSKTEDWRVDVWSVPTFHVAYVQPDARWDRVHAPQPTSARWEGPPPRSARKR